MFGSDVGHVLSLGYLLAISSNAIITGGMAKVQMIWQAGEENQLFIGEESQRIGHPIIGIAKGFATLAQEGHQVGKIPLVYLRWSIELRGNPRGEAQGALHATPQVVTE